MNIIINGKHLDITPAIRNYSEEKVKKFERFVPNISEAVVTLSVEKYRHKAEVLLRVNGIMIQAESITQEIYSAIDEVTEKLERQIKKYKDKLKSRRQDAKQVTGTPLPETPAVDAAFRIIRRKKFSMKPMSPEEAAMQMDLLDKDFFIFSNDKTGDINVIYKRNDGDFGLIEPAK
ncbi:MAG: ribosome hibernation-promoting factor, HPF/YfiA family [bacterium]